MSDPHTTTRPDPAHPGAESHRERLVDRWLTRWLGVTLSVVGVVAIVALAVTGRLELYIHPRYVVFTVSMAVIAAVGVVTALLLLPGRADSAHEHDHGHPASPMRRVLAVAGSAAVVLAAVVGLLVLPPASLTSATAQNRDATTSATLDSAETTALVGGDSSQFTVKDWAALLRQNPGVDFFAGKPADISGFVYPSDDPDVFYVARFLITCCAVDALPLIVPVHYANWETEFAADDWVEVTGQFAQNPDAASDEAIVLVPTRVAPIEEPSQPYVY